MSYFPAGKVSLVAKYICFLWELNFKTVNTEGGQTSGFFDVKEGSTGGLIPQSLQRQTKVTLDSLGWRHNKRECAKCYAKRSVCAVRAVEVPVFFRLRSSCSHVTEVGGTYRLETSSEGCHARRRALCGCNLVIHKFFQEPMSHSPST